MFCLHIGIYNVKLHLEERVVFQNRERERERRGVSEKEMDTNIGRQAAVIEMQALTYNVRLTRVGFKPENVLFHTFVTRSVSLNC